MEDKVIDLVLDKDGVFKTEEQCEAPVKQKRKPKPKKQEPLQQEPLQQEQFGQYRIEDTPLYKFFDGAQIGMEALEKAMRIFKR